MELEQYLKLFKKYFVFIAICAAGGAVVAALSTKFLPQGYNLPQTFYLASLSSPAQGTYNFDGFYAQEKARNFTDTAVAILESPDFQREVAASDQALAVKKLAPQLIRITAIGPTRESSQQLLAKTVDAFNRKFEIPIKEIAKPQEPFFHESSRKIYSLAGLVLGITTAIVVISLKTYFRL